MSVKSETIREGMYLEPVYNSCVRVYQVNQRTEGAGSSTVAIRAIRPQSGDTWTQTVKWGHQVNVANVEKRPAKFLYNEDGKDYFELDDTSELVDVEPGKAWAAKVEKDSMEVVLVMRNGRPVDVTPRGYVAPTNPDSLYINGRGAPDPSAVKRTNH